MLSSTASYARGPFAENHKSELVDRFHIKLHVLNSCLLHNNLTHFPSCMELVIELEETDFHSVSETITELLDEFSARFADFEGLSSSVQLFTNPMEVSIEQQPKDLQLEMYELQGTHCSSEGRMHAVFASAYFCENLFSTVKHVKSSGFYPDSLLPPPTTCGKEL
uniref:Uncharacterized protein n=1 Tax=Callorhinchus milii TaxID=7868 RepID=A0A4W3H7R8_CALMI